MKAAINTRYGPPEVAEIREVPDPEPGPGEVRIRVHTSTVSRTDCGTRKGHPFFARLMTGLFAPKATILGMDFAGIVDRAGDGVTRYAPGDRVFGMSTATYGAHAEYLCQPEDGNIAHVPEGVSLEDAVICEGAWYASSTTDRLAPGQDILVYGASGAIGTAAVQLAKAGGAHVTAVVGTKHVELAASLGAGRVVDYQSEDFTATDARFDIVFDAVGKTSWFACRHLLKSGGIFAATDLGPYWSNIVLGIAFMRSKRVVIPFPVENPAFVSRMADMMTAGSFHGVFDRTFALDEIVEAYRYVETESKTGIVRLTVV